MPDADLAKLVGTLVPFAQRLLRQHGDFFPFAATMDRAGNVAHVGGDMGTERPSSADLVAFLRDALRAEAERGEVRACGMCLNVAARLPGYAKQVDAICCQLEDDGGGAAQIFVPFRKRFFGRFKFDRAIALPGDSSVFAPR